MIFVRTRNLNRYEISLQLASERRRSPHDGDSASVDDSDFVAQALSLIHIVGAEENRGSLLLEFLDVVPHVAAHLNVQADGRLIQKDQRRLEIGRASCRERVLT